MNDLVSYMEKIICILNLTDMLIYLSIWKVMRSRL